MSVLNAPFLCRRSQSATSSANMSMESLPLLHQAPSPEQQPVLQQNKDLSPGSQAELSKPDLNKTSPCTVDRAGPHADNLHAANAKADTLGMRTEGTPAIRNSSFTICIAWCLTSLSGVMQSSRGCSLARAPFHMVCLCWNAQEAPCASTSRLRTCMSSVSCQKW